MLMLTLVLHEEPHWPELAGSPERIVHLGNDAPPIQIASLPHGTSGGRASVCLRLDLPDGRVVLAETTLALFLTAANALAAKYPQESAGLEPDGQVQRALQAAHAALRSYQHGNAAPDLAQEIADHLEAILREL